MTSPQPHRPGVPAPRPGKHILLLPGLWLDAGAWSAVEQELTGSGHEVQSLSLPGQGDGRTDATLADQVDAVLESIDRSAGPVVVVGHSAASALAWIAADRRPRAVAAVVMVGGMPVESGKPYANFFPVVAGAMPFPGWEAFTEADAADVDQEARSRIVVDAVPVPDGVCHALVALADEARFDVPVTLVCPEYSVGDAKEWIDQGFVPELARARSVDFVDIDSGHWPMLTRAQELARIIHEVAQQ